MSPADHQSLASVAISALFIPCGLLLLVFLTSDRFKTIRARQRRRRTR